MTVRLVLTVPMTERYWRFRNEKAADGGRAIYIELGWLRLGVQLS